MTYRAQNLLAAFGDFVRRQRLEPVAEAVAHRLWRSHGGYARLFATERELARRQHLVLEATLVAIARGTFLREKAAEIARWAEDTHPRVPRRAGVDSDAVVILAAQREALLGQIPAFTRDFDKAMVLVRTLERLFTLAQDLLLQVFYQARMADAARIEQLAKELADGKAFFQRLVDLAPVAIGFVDRSLAIRWLNPMAHQWLGLAPGQAVGRPVQELAGGPSIGHVRRVLEQGRDLVLQELPWQLPGTPPRYLDVAYVPMADGQREVDGVLVLCVDVTARVVGRRGAEARIRALEDLDRLKTNFINAASHELRTPLSAILGFAEFLEDELGGPLTSEQRGFVAEIQAGTRRLQRLVDDLLDFARVEAGSFQLVWRPANLTDLAKEEASSLRPQAQARGLEVELDLPASPVRLPMDAMRVGQVLLNLLANAIKFTPPGGRVRLSLEEDEEEATVAVQDTGIGIPAEHLPRLFQKFYQVDPSTTRSHGGAGLGLAISKAIVEAHGGRIGVLSQPGQGSTFWFTLPKLLAEPRQAASQAQPDHIIRQASDA
jgi:PAS domain S-box-containing protein